MYLLGVIIVCCIGIWLYMTAQPETSLWNDMVSQRFSVKELKRMAPDYVHRWETLVKQAETVTRDVLTQPLHHSKYPYQKVKDEWQDVISCWDEMACAPGTTFLQEEVAFGSRFLKEYVNRKLEYMKQFDDTKWRTVWIGAGQPRDTMAPKYGSLLV